MNTEDVITDEMPAHPTESSTISMTVDQAKRILPADAVATILTKKASGATLIELAMRMDPQYAALAPLFASAITTLLDDWQGPVCVAAADGILFFLNKHPADREASRKRCHDIWLKECAAEQAAARGKSRPK